MNKIVVTVFTMPFSKYNELKSQLNEYNFRITYMSEIYDSVIFAGELDSEDVNIMKLKNSPILEYMLKVNYREMM